MYENSSRNRFHRGTADFDRPSPAVIERRREADLAFLEWVRLATVDEMRDYEHSRPLPQWRRVAIARAMNRL